MHDFTPDETRRWAAWQSANELSADRSGRVMHVIWFGIVGVSLITLAVVLANLT